MSISINRTLAGKNILITGASGFVGKVLFEKVLRSIPEIGTIYLLIRGNARSRLVKNIMPSEIFTTLKAQLGVDDLTYLVEQGKVVGISGDVQQERVGLSDKDYQLLQNEVNFVVHCAATVDFKERLDNAVKQNVLGTLEIFETAKTFKNLQAFCHVSTCYVNSDRPGVHEEVLPPLNFDPEEMIQLVLQMDIQELERATPRILGAYPNTYTFTKAMAEKLLEKRRGNVPVCFVRPSIVGASLKEPMPGWIDSIAAMAAVVLYAGVGLVRFIHGDHHVIADIVPVDVVSNVILLALANTANSPAKDLKIYHAGTSHLNPVKWYEAARWVSTYWRQHNVQRRVDQTPLRFKFYKNDYVYKTHFYLRNELPATIYAFFAKYLGTEQQKKTADMMSKVVQRTAQFTDAFSHFTSTYWVFSMRNSEDAIARLVEPEKAVYALGIREMDWEKYFRLFCYGMQRYVLAEQVKEPSDLLKIDLVQEPRRVPEIDKSLLGRIMPDLAWAFKPSYKSNIGIDNFNTMRTPAETKDLIIKASRVQKVIRKVAESEGVEASIIESRARKELDRMCHTLRLPITRALGYFLRKVWRRIYEGIHVEEKGLELVRNALPNGPLLLIPTHRSYVDFLIVSYIFFEYDLPLPHIAAGEDFLGILFVNWIFRNCGAFFLRRQIKGDDLYVALFTEYVQRLVQDWSPIEFFIEGKRSRTGKSLHPKFGLLSICVEPFLQKKVPDLTVVPISISYEKALEAELYSNELLGEKKIRESFQGLLKASKILQLNFGRINVIFNQPISVREYLEKQSLAVEAQKNRTQKYDPFNNENDRKHFLTELGYDITNELNKGLVVTPTALTATILLECRKGITRQDLFDKVNWLREDVASKGALLSHEGTTQEMVKHSLELMAPLVNEVRNQVYIPAETNERGKNHKSILTLDYYRNQLLHLYHNEGMVACALFGLTYNLQNTSPSRSKSKDKDQDPAHKDGVKKETLIKEACFLKGLLWLEFVDRSTEKDMEETISKTIDSLVAAGSLAQNRDRIQVTSHGEGYIFFLCHLFWHFVESYWVTALSLFSLQPNVKVKKSLLLHRIQWIAEKMHSEGKLMFYESCSMEVLVNTLELYQQWKLIDFRPELMAQGPQLSGGKKKRRLRGARPPPPEDPVICLLAPYDQELPLQELVDHINRFRKQQATYTKDTGYKKAMIADFPVLSKL